MTNSPDISAHGTQRKHRLLWEIAVPLAGIVGVGLYAGYNSQQSNPSEKDPRTVNYTSCSHELIKKSIDDDTGTAEYMLRGATRSGKALMKKLIIIESAGDKFEYTVNGSTSAPQLLRGVDAESGKNTQADVIITEPYVNGISWDVDVIPGSKRDNDFDIKITDNC